MARLAEHHPHLVRRYERLCAEGAYVPTWYQRRITRRVHEPAAEYGIGPADRGLPRRIRRAESPGGTDTDRPPAGPDRPTQLTLL